MTKVEEREMVSSELLRMLEDVANREIPCQVAYRDIQKRLTAAHSEGVAEGAEHIREEEAANWVAIHKEFPNLPHWTEIERLRDAIFAGHTATVNVDALCAVVAEQERERIRNASEYTGMFGTYIVPAAYLGYPPASVLAPTKEGDK